MECLRTRVGASQSAPLSSEDPLALGATSKKQPPPLCQDALKSPIVPFLPRDNTATCSHNPIDDHDHSRIAERRQRNDMGHHSLTGFTVSGIAVYQRNDNEQGVIARIQYEAARESRRILAVKHTAEDHTGGWPTRLARQCGRHQGDPIADL